jgi:hypothetical protein
MEALERAEAEERRNLIEDYNRRAADEARGSARAKETRLPVDAIETCSQVGASETHGRVGANETRSQVEEQSRAETKSVQSRPEAKSGRSRTMSGTTEAQGQAEVEEKNKRSLDQRPAHQENRIYGHGLRSYTRLHKMKTLYLEKCYKYV